MKKPDINFFELQSCRRYTDLVVQPNTGFATEGGVEVFRREVFGPDGKPITFSDAVKGSKVTSTTISTYLVAADNYDHTAAEDAIDLNNGCMALRFNHGTITCGRKNGITIKGGCHDIAFDDLIICGRPHTHIDLGNHSDQSFVKSSKLEFKDVRCEDGKPVILRVGWSHKPVLIGTNVKRLVIEGGALKVYVFAKHFLPFIP